MLQKITQQKEGSILIEKFFNHRENRERHTEFHGVISVALCENSLFSVVKNKKSRRRRDPIFV